MMFVHLEQICIFVLFFVPILVRGQRMPWPTHYIFIEKKVPGFVELFQVAQPK